MKILHINTSDSGGAGTACIRIHQELLDQGIDSKVLVLNKTKNIKGVYVYDYLSEIKNKFCRYYKKIQYEYYVRKNRRRFAKLPHSPVLFSFSETFFDITNHPLYKEADIIQLNWTSGFLDEPSFFRKNTKPVVWRMADLYVCGGGYHYEKNFPFDTYQSVLRNNDRLREKSLKNKSLYLVPISNWTKEKALESNLVKNFPMKVIHNGLDLNLFKPYDKNFARNFWDLPQDKTILLFGADGVNDPRKGLHLLLETLDKLKDDNLFLCCFGGEISNKKVLSVGSINDYRLQPLLYSAADYFIMPSIEETFGQVTIEALACGTPVVSFPNGGSLDIINDGFNGVLAGDFTSEALSRALNTALNTIFDRNKIREDILKRFNINDKATEYIELYKSLLRKKATNMEISTRL
ncbi:glycosyl transferase family 1 [Bacteroidia bacterium]|nr:glycosyl transferase family 1 [Bacteroidia bacterium]